MISLPVLLLLVTGLQAALSVALVFCVFQLWRELRRWEREISRPPS